MTEQQIRAVFSDPPGDTTLKLYTDAEGQPVRISLRTPDLTDLTADSMLAEVRGIELTIRREDGENGHQISTTVLRLPGLEEEGTRRGHPSGGGEKDPQHRGNEQRRTAEADPVHEADDPEQRPQYGPGAAQVRFRPAGEQAVLIPYPTRHRQTTGPDRGARRRTWTGN